jgi:acyl-CoA reductase-like NAD-dependent aldehyde dehydrogenase
MLESTTMGPLVSQGQFETVQRYVRQGVEAGFGLVAGGNALVDEPDRKGFYYEPTAFDNVAPDSSLAEEEIFGPVLPIIRVRDAEEAIALPNRTRYGLAAALFTSRLKLIAKFTARVQAGMIHINHGTASHAHVPFGGRKESGQGAFSIGPTAKDFFTNVKAVYVKG